MSKTGGKNLEGGGKTPRNTIDGDFDQNDDFFPDNFASSWS